MISNQKYVRLGHFPSLVQSTKYYTKGDTDAVLLVDDEHSQVGHKS